RHQVGWAVRPEGAPVWKLAINGRVRGDGRKSREAIADGRGLLLRLAFLVRGEPRYVSGLRRVRRPPPRLRRGGTADACRPGSTAHPWCRCTWASNGACWGHATWSMSSPMCGEPAVLAVALRNPNLGTCHAHDRPTCRARLSAGGTAPARRTAE